MSKRAARDEGPPPLGDGKRTYYMQAVEFRHCGCRKPLVYSVFFHFPHVSLGFFFTYTMSLL